MKIDLKSPLMKFTPVGKFKLLVMEVVTSRPAIDQDEKYSSIKSI